MAVLCLLAACWADRHLAFLRPYGATGFSLLAMIGCLAGMIVLTLCMGLGSWPRIQHLAIRYRSLHGYIGITTGSLLAMGFLAGTVTLFATPLQEWSQPRLPASETIPLTDIPSVLNHLSDMEHGHYRATDHQYRLTLTSPVSARLSLPAAPELPLGRPAAQILVTQPQAGTVQLYQLVPSPVPAVIGGLHRRMGLPLPESWAMPLVGLICFFYGLALLSGIILLLPGIWRTLMTVRLEGHARRFWLDLHSLLGLYSLPFQLVIALTVALFALAPLLPTGPGLRNSPPTTTGPASRGAAFPESGAGNSPPTTTGPASRGAAFPESGAGNSPPTTTGPASPLPPAVILTQMQAFAPDFRPLTLDYVPALHMRDNLATRQSLHAPLYDASGFHGLPPSGQPYLLLEGTDPRNPLIGRDRGSILLDPHTGTILDSQNLPGRQPLARRILTWCLALHFGSFGGEFVRWLYVILGLCGVGFFHTANQLWLNSHRRRIPGQPAPVETSATLWTARLSEGSLSGCLLGLCGLMVLSPLMSHLHPVTSLTDAVPHDPEQARQEASLTFYALVALSLASYCLFPRRVCRGMILALSAACLSTAVVIVTLHHMMTRTSALEELTMAFAIASLCLWYGAFHVIRSRR
ncbi:PepSY-associated TM helix domain-containing protein [Bombella mellum]|nr:PepSY-associated TM helix domain-containing protein [Bombella mellum]